MNRKEFTDVVNLVSMAFDTDTDTIHFKEKEIFVENKIFGMVTKFDVGFEASISGTNFQQLLKLLDKDDGEEITITNNKNSIGLLNNKYRFQKFTIKDIKLKELNFKKLPDDFYTALKFCLPSVSDKEMYGVLNAINFNKDLITTCDNSTVTTYKTSFVVDKEFNLPRLTGILISELRPALFCIDGNKVYFKTADEKTIIFSVLMAGEYPSKNIEERFKTQGTKFSLPKEISKTLKRANICANKDKTNNLFVIIDIKKDKIIVKSSDGRGESEVPIEYKNDNEVEIKVNVQQLEYGLQISNEFNLIDQKYLMFNGEFKHLLCTSFF
jgi:hypothetical protein